MSWIEYQEKYRNSVLQLIVVFSIYNPKKPYKNPDDKKASGSGFFISAENGLLLTNGHVVDNSISIIGRIPKLGKIDLRIKLVRYCKDKDIALCQIYKEDLDIVQQKLGDLTKLNLPLGDNFELKETDEVMAIGYPLGEDEIKFTNGTVSGFFPNVDSKDNDDDDLTISEDKPTYIQITAAINSGNSGGCLLNKQGKVVGINSAGYMFYQNIAFAIGTRTIIGILSGLLEPISNNFSPPSLNDKTALIPKDEKLILKIPKFSFEWCPVNKYLLESFVDSNIEGIYVTKVYPDSCFPELQTGDIITDIKIDITPKYNLIKYKNNIVDGKFDNWRTLDIKDLQRNIKLKELTDIIPIGNKITLILWRNNTEYKMEVLYIPTNIYPLIYKSFRFQLLDYEIVAGMCITPLTLNYVNYDSDLLKYSKGKNRYSNKLIVVDIFPDTEISKTKCIQTGMFLKSVNNNPVNNLEELRMILQNVNDMLYFNFSHNVLFVVDTKQIIKEDKAIIENYEINHKYILDK